MPIVDPRETVNTSEQSASEEASYIEKALGLVLLLVLFVCQTARNCMPKHTDLG